MADEPDIEALSQASLDELEAALKAAESDAKQSAADAASAAATTSGDVPPQEKLQADPLATADQSGGQSHDAPPAGADSVPDGDMDQISIDELLKSANFEDPAAAADSVAGVGSSAESAAEHASVQGIELPNFSQVMHDAQVSSIELLRDVELNVKIELGRSRMMVEDVLKLSEGSVVELDKLAGDPVDVFVNDRLVARGEVLVLNDNFCVRVNEIVAGARDELT